MELDQEKQNQEAAERCRALAQRVVRELAPRSVQVLEDSGLLEKAFCKMNTAVVQSAPELLVVADPQWVTLPAVQAEKVLLVCAEYAGMADCAKQLAAQGFCRELAWKDRGKEQLTALFCRMAAPELPELEDGYEQQLDVLRERTLLAERTAAQQAAQLERLRSDLSLSRSHAKNLEKTLNEVTSSTFWKLTWPMRYVVSKSRQIWHTFPLFVLLGELRRDGISGVREHARARREYAALFPGNLLRADRFAPVELLVRQANDQPAGPKISIVVPLYNTPLDFLDEMLDSVVNQTYKNWELCCVDAGKDEAVGQHVQARAKADARIRYQKLEKNELIPGNTNKGFEMATGEYIALLDHDDILHPAVLFEYAKVINEKNADYIYCDEITFEGDSIDHMIVLHFKPDFAIDNLRGNNYICHFSAFSRHLLDETGVFRSQYDGSQDHDMILRLTDRAEKIVHVPRLMYYWRSHEGSTAASIDAKPYAIEAAKGAVADHLKKHGFKHFQITSTRACATIFRIRYQILGDPKISIVIANKDHVEDLKRCITSIQKNSTWSNYEIIVVENNSTTPEIKDYYSQLLGLSGDDSYEERCKLHTVCGHDGGILHSGDGRISIVTYHGDFNYSAVNDLGASYASGEYILLLNNDTEVITANWMEEMLMYAQREDVGAVGAKLYYADKTIQHAGVVIGLGAHRTAGHTHYRIPVQNLGYMGRLCYTQNVTAVTGACLLVKKSLYEQVGGLDESFVISLNDVDLCMKLRKLGLLNVWTPFAELYHYESISRGLDDQGEKAERYNRESEHFREKWKAELEAGDPYYNPNFSLDRSDYALKDPAVSGR